MKVWAVVTEVDYEGSEVEKVYATETSAAAECERLKQLQTQPPEVRYAAGWFGNPNEIRVEEWDVLP